MRLSAVQNLLVMSFFLLIAEFAVCQEYRLWRDDQGSPPVRARLIRVVDDRVFLRAENSHFDMVFEFSKFSAADQAYIRQQEIHVQSQPHQQPAETTEPQAPFGQFGGGWARGSPQDENS